MKARIKFDGLRKRDLPASKFRCMAKWVNTDKLGALESCEIDLSKIRGHIMALKHEVEIVFLTSNPEEYEMFELYEGNRYLGRGMII